MKLFLTLLQSKNNFKLGLPKHLIKVIFGLKDNNYLNAVCKNLKSGEEIIFGKIENKDLIGVRLAICPYTMSDLV